MGLSQLVPNTDIAMGVGGFPRERISEIYGPESIGGPLYVYTLLPKRKNSGSVCAFIDMEHALDPTAQRLR